MNSSSSSENVSSFIKKLLDAKDPATIGLRKIIRKKSEDLNDYPLRKVTFEEFDSPAKKKGILSDEERRTLELEKQVSEFELLLKKQQERSNLAIQDAYNKGKNEGVQLGTEKGKAEASAIYKKNIDGIQKNVTSCLKKMENSKHDIFSCSDHIVLKLCIEMAKKIIASEITTRQDIILNTTKKALSYIAERERMVIRVSPDDFKTVNDGRDFWEPVTERLKQILIESDERVSKGGCIIESNNGSVDARIGVQIDEISDLIEKMWTNEHSSQASNTDNECSESSSVSV